MQKEGFSQEHPSNQDEHIRRHPHVQPRPIVYERRYAPKRTHPRLIDDFVVPVAHKSKVHHVSQPETPKKTEPAAPPQSEAKIKKRHKKINSEKLAPIALTAMALAIFLGGAFVSVASWHTNNQAAGQVNKMAKSTLAPDSGANPSTDAVTSQQINSYNVAADLPRYIDISSLKVHARVKGLGTTGTNQLKAPSNVYDAGWYNASAKPGQNGAMLIDGHISNWNTKGVFYGLKNLKPDDIIKITRGDSQVFNYKVVKSQLFDEDKVNMSSLLVSQDTSKPGLNLISCSGDVIPGSNEFNKRLVVYAVAN